MGEIKTKIKLSDVVKIIIELENKYNLFKLEISNVYIWKLIRVRLINEIMLEFSLYDVAHSKKKLDKKLILGNVIKKILREEKKSENIIFTHDRFFLDGTIYKEIHTYDLCDKLNNVEVVYPISTSKKFINTNYNFSVIESFDFVVSKFKKKVLKNKVEFSKYFLKILEQLKNELENELNGIIVNILEINEIKKVYKTFVNEKKYYKKYLNKKKSKKIYLVCSYGKEGLIAAAQELGIEVIEIQHGVMNKYHLGYHFPHNSEIPYFPDKLLMFGEYWYKNINIPLKQEKIEFVGYPYLEKQLDKYRNKLQEKENQVLFISQGTIGKELTKKAIEFAKENLDKKIIIRLHPGEFSRWKTEYQVLYENRHLKNIEISDNNKKNLYEYLFESRYIFCVYSTVIYEAIYLGKKVGILNLPGIENIEDLIRKKIVYLFKENEEIQLNKLNNLNKEYLNIF